MDCVLPGTFLHQSPVLPQKCLAQICFTCRVIRNNLIQNLFKHNKLVEQFQSSTDITHINTEHIVPFKITSCIIVRVMVYLTVRASRPSVQLVVKMLKLRRQGSYSLLVNSFEAEWMFYKYVAVRLTYLIHPKCYHLDSSICIQGYPFIILDDLITLGYKQFKGKLKKNDLIKVLKILALFHGDTMKLLNEDENMKSYAENFFEENKKKNIVKQQKAIR
ncbi:uncharacterized protein LOC105279234 [Ooceraea biroi]|nr:uncharacterized protein LOC105279234 [Ooceraea biroi]